MKVYLILTKNKIEDEDNTLLSKDKRIEINNLKRKQTEEEFTPEEKSFFLELQEKKKVSCLNYLSFSLSFVRNISTSLFFI